MHNRELNFLGTKALPYTTHLHSNKHYLQMQFKAPNQSTPSVIPTMKNANQNP
jgi:ribosomal protein S6